MCFIMVEGYTSTMVFTNCVNGNWHKKYYINRSEYTPKAQWCFGLLVVSCFKISHAKKFATIS